MTRSDPSYRRCSPSVCVCVCIYTIRIVRSCKSQTSVRPSVLSDARSSYVGEQRSACRAEVRALDELPCTWPASRDTGPNEVHSPPANGRLMKSAARSPSSAQPGLLLAVLRDARRPCCFLSAPATLPAHPPL